MKLNLKHRLPFQSLLLQSTLPVLFLLPTACSDTAQFNNAVAGDAIDAERIITSDLPTTDPSADATAPGDPNDPANGGTGDPAANSGDPNSSGGGSGTGASGSGTGTGTGTGAGGTGGGGGGSGGGGGGTSGPSTEEKIANLKAACSSGARKTMKQSIRFGEVRQCNWGVGGNLGRLDAHVQAVEGQKAKIELPANAQLCELGIGSVATTIQYDDFMLLTLNNQVLLSSNKELLVDLDKDADSARVWDFTKVRGKAIDFDAAPYRLGNDASYCKIPVTDVPGAFQFSIDPSSLGKLAANSKDKKILEFALYATGDNDDRDCWHTAFTLDFTMNYVE